MNGGSGARCYIVLGRNTMNGGHRETEKLTARSTATVAASEKAPTAWVDDGGGWREKERTSEVESEELKVKSRKSRYVRHRWVEAELRDTSATGIALGNEGFTCGEECLDASRGKGRRSTRFHDL